MKNVNERCLNLTDNMDTLSVTYPPYFITGCNGLEHNRPSDLYSQDLWFLYLHILPRQVWVEPDDLCAGVVPGIPVQPPAGQDTHQDREEQQTCLGSVS